MLNAKGCAFAFPGVNPKPPLKALLSIVHPLLSLRSGGELIDKPTHCCMVASLKGHLVVAHRLTTHSG